VSGAGASSRGAYLITLLGLQPHPEGGYFTETFRSESHVQPLDGRQRRTALTTIYLEGAPLELWLADAGLSRVERLMLGPIGQGCEPVRIATAGVWQAARTTGEYTLVGCTVGPGFDFDDFEMLRDTAAAADAMRARHPEGAAFI
jgi:predicted cupin superfamily sugar epimerase